MSAFKPEQPYLTGIEIGTSTIKVLIARMGADLNLEVVGFAEVPSLKMCKGEAQNAKIVKEQVATALSRAQANAGLEELTGLCFFALSGSYIESFCLTGKIDFDEPGHLITLADFETATRATNSYQPPEGKFHLQSRVNRIYRLGDGRTIFNPIGQSSPMLEVEIQHFIADIARANTTCGLLYGVLGQHLDSIIYTPLTLGAALLKEEVSDDDMPLLIDLGAGMTSVAVPTSVGHLHCAQIAIGCDHVANDISLAFGIPIQSARMILNQLDSLHCTAVASHDGQSRILNCALPSRHEQRLLPASSLEMVIEARLQELFELIRQQLNEQQVLSWIGKRVILSGGGALIPRVTELAARVFNRPQVEVAHPFDISGRLDFKPLPQYVTVIGLIRAGYRDYLVGEAAANERNNFGNLLKTFWTAVSDW